MQPDIDEGEETPLMSADELHQQRQVLHVRKVRSEMKYVETYSKDNSKKRESKSDHEFANERDVSNVILLTRDNHNKHFPFYSSS